MWWIFIVLGYGRPCQTYEDQEKHTGSHDIHIQHHPTPKISKVEINDCKSIAHWFQHIIDMFFIFFDGDSFSSVLLGMVHHDVSEVVFQSKKYIEISTYMVLPFFWAILKEGHAEMLGAVWRNQGSTMKLPSRGFRIIAVLRSPSRTPRVGLTWSCWFFWNRLGVFHPRPHFRPHFRGLQWSFVGSGVSIWDHHHHIYIYMWYYACVSTQTSVWD